MTGKRICMIVLTLWLLLLPASALESKTLLEGVVNSGSCTDEVVRWRLDSGGTLHIYGTGTMGDWDWRSLGVHLPVRKLIVTEGITEMGVGAFSGCTELKEVQLPGSLEEIHASTFENCTALEQIRIPEGVTYIDDCAFAGCTSLRQVWLAESLRGVGDDAFLNTPYLAGQEEFLRSKDTLLRYLGTDKNVTIPDGITAIGTDCFKGHQNIVSITIPDSVRWIGQDAFAGTGWLTGRGVFPVVNGILFAYQGEEEEVVVPDGVEQIAPGAFAGVEMAKKITLPEGCTVIGEYAFSGCSGVKTIELPSTVREIGRYAFYNCSRLRVIQLPEGLKGLEDGLFSGCSKLECIDIPDSVTWIGDWVFELCDSLESVELSENLTTVGQGLFYRTVKVTSITLPAKLVNLDRMTFDDAHGLKSIKVAEENPFFSSEDGVLYSKDGTRLIYCPQGRERDLSIPEGVEKIEDCAFYGNARTRVIHIPNSVTEIGSHAFFFSDIEVIRFGKNSQLQRVGEGAFAQCVCLDPFQLPDTVTYMGDAVFSNCVEMTEISIPKGVTRIYGTVAPFCNVKEVSIHSDVVWIAPDAFPVFEEPVTILAEEGSLAHACALEYGLGFEAVETTA